MEPERAGCGRGRWIPDFYEKKQKEIGSTSNWKDIYNISVGPTLATC